MDLYSYGRNFYTDYKIPMKLIKNDNFHSTLSCCQCFIIIIIQEGSCLLKLNDKQYPIIAPAVLCVNEKENFIFEKSNQLKTYSIYFHPNVINNSFNYDNIRGNVWDTFSTTVCQDIYTLEIFLNRNVYSGYCAIGPNTLRRLNYLYDKIQSEIEEQRDMGWPCRHRSYFIEICYMLRRIYDLNPVDETLSLDYVQNSESIINDVIYYLYSNYSRKITITELINTFHINKTSLMEKFSNSTGFTIMNYLTRIRVNVAAMILRDTTMSVSEIMERVGFVDMSHFGRMFKKYMGYSPSEYRQKYCWMIS